MESRIEAVILLPSAEKASARKGANPSLAGDPKAFREINWLAEHHNRAAEDAAGQPAPQPRGFWSAFAENQFDAMMVHRDDGYWRLSARDRVGGTVFDDGKVITAGSLIEDEEIVTFQKINVFARSAKDDRAVRPGPCIGE